MSFSKRKGEAPVPAGLGLLSNPTAGHHLRAHESRVFFWFYVDVSLVFNIIYQVGFKLYWFQIGFMLV